MKDLICSRRMKPSTQLEFSFMMEMIPFDGQLTFDHLIIEKRAGEAWTPPNRVIAYDKTPNPHVRF